MTAVLLTGATGFLGGALCAELLRATEDTVYCPVRGATFAGARRRLHANVGRYLQGFDPRRLVALRGDITAPRLGLSTPDYDSLADTIRVVYHSAATVNLAADYEYVAPTNVIGTQRLLAFARHRSAKPVHHVSTAAVFTRARQQRHPVVSESTVPTRQMSDVVGYSQSKCVAEDAVRRAAVDGVPTAIYRPGLVLGHSVTGMFSDTELSVRLLRGAIAIGCAPNTTCDVPAAPVDHLARAIVVISKAPQALGAAWHPNSPRPLHIADLFTHAGSIGYPMQTCTVANWRQALLSAAANLSTYLVLAVWEIMKYLLATTEYHTPPHMDCTATNRLLAHYGVHAPPLDESLFHTIIWRVANEGIIPPIPSTK